MPELKIPDGNLHYEVFGSGPPLLFLSQTAWYGGIWKLEQVPDLSRDHMVIVYDQRGTGMSRVDTKDFSTARLAADAIAVLDAVGVGKANVCGHSNGGRVAQVMALDYPERVDRLLLASAGGSGSKNSQGGLPLGMVLEIIEKGYPGYARTHSLETGFTKAFLEAHPERANALMDDTMANLALPEIFLRHVLGRQGTDTTGRLKDIKAPTLVMVGDDEDHGASSDLTHLASARILAETIPGARFVVFPGEGHNYWFSAPKRFNSAVRDFIAGR
ncbi:MAG TPA: alpha/beta hydrolase [Alphaproteobacteria bacterium]|nr:alpha/beta hydrolase [Alphaproteobacteria bacterium]